MQQEVDKMKFEIAMQELESIVRRLESGQEDLDISITLFERGAQLQKHCQNILNNAQLRVEKIVQDPNSNEITTEKVDCTKLS